MLLVLEDTGELLRPDAKEHVGQGLARLLNVVDGLLGQGLRVLVLITTNEEIGKLHEAVTRPGRCAQEIDFKPLTADESRAWLAAHGRAEDRSASALIADLFAQLEGREAKELAPIGFTG